MEKVIIVQGASSAMLFVQECRLRGMEPIILNPPKFVKQDRESFNRFVGRETRFINMKSYDEYDDVLEKVREINPVCVVCGSSAGVDIADRLAKDLGLKGNDPETTWRRDTKNGMHQSLKEAGLRYIRTAVVTKEEDIKRFWKENNIDKAIMKFSESAGAVGNKVCLTLQDSLDYLKVIRKGKNIYDRQEPILIQEFIEGDEYVVDTVSCDGKHIVCALWKYNKMVSKDKDIVTEETCLIVHPQPGITELVSYAYDVLDATGFRYGVCHGEYKVDDKGPVLIETNPRPHGATLTVEYLNEFLPNHITDVALDSYLSPESFLAKASMPYRPTKYAKFKHLFSPKECDVNMIMLRKILSMMKSYRYSVTDFKDEIMHIDKTIDLETSPGILKLCNSDYAQLMRDCDFLYTLETKYFDLIEKGNDTVNAVKKKADMDRILGLYPPYWSVLVVGDGKDYVWQWYKKTKVDDIESGFDAVVYVDSSRSKVADRLDSILRSVNRLKESGGVVVVPEVYQNLPYGSAAVEIVLNLAGCTLQVPQRNSKSVLAWKY